MNAALILPDLHETRSPHRNALLTRSITCVGTLDYDSLTEESLDDLQLDRTSVLTGEEEFRLFAQMNLAYHQAAALRSGMKADEDDETAWTELERILQRGDAIRNQLMLIFHKLTVSIVKHFTGPRHSLEEVVSEGHATLLRAVALFDPARGFRFSTYATHAIRRRLSRYVKSRQHVHFLPVDYSEAPPIEDHRRWTLPYTREVEAGVAWLETALYELTPRERYVLRCRFGWGREFEPRTLQDIADELSVSRERVRQLEVRAIKKLQAVAAAIDLVDADVEPPIAATPRQA
jgi:RNA polymerase primary sigma factor